MAIAALLLGTLGSGTAAAVAGKSSAMPISAGTSVTSTADADKPPVWDLAGRAQYSISGWFRDLALSALDPILATLGRTIFSTPHVEKSTRVAQLWRFSLGIANALFLILVLVGAALVMTGSLSGQVTAKELLPRLLLAASAANLCLFLTGQLITFTNAMTQALLGSAADSSTISKLLSERLFSASIGNGLFVMFLIAILLLAVLVVVTYVVRVALLIVLLAAGPLVLAAHTLPQTDNLARTWWRLLAAMTVSPLIQAFLLSTAVRIFLSGDGILGLPTAGGLMDLLVVGCLFYLLYKIPLWTINQALNGAGSRAAASAKRASVTAVKAAVAA